METLWRRRAQTPVPRVCAVLLVVITALEGLWPALVSSARAGDDVRDELALMENGLATLRDLPPGTPIVEFPVGSPALSGLHLLRQTQHRHPLLIAEFSRYQLLRARTLEKHRFLQMPLTGFSDSPEALAEALHAAGVGAVIVDQRHLGQPLPEAVLDAVEKQGIAVITVE